MILPKVPTERESLRGPTQTRPTAAEAQLWKAGLSFKKKLDYNEGAEEWERYLALGWCCFGLAWWAVPGCWGSACGPGRWRWAAALQPTGAVQFWGHAKWSSYPSGCKHTTSLNISASVTSRQPDWWEARGTLGLGPALPVLPDVRVCLHSGAQRHGSCCRGLWRAGGWASWQAMCAHEWNWLKPHRLQNPLEHFLVACNWLVRAPGLWALFVFLFLLILILFSSLKGGLWKDSGKRSKGSAYKTCQSSAILFILSKIGKFKEIWLSFRKKGEHNMSHFNIGQSLRSWAVWQFRLMHNLTWESNVGQ